MNESINQWTNERTNERMNIWTNKRTDAWTNGWTSEWMIECVSQCNVDGWMVEKDYTNGYNEPHACFLYDQLRIEINEEDDEIPYTDKTSYVFCAQEGTSGGGMGQVTVDDNDVLAPHREHTYTFKGTCPTSVTCASGISELNS